MALAERRSSPSCSEAGMTLLEVTLACGLMSVAFVMIIGSLMSVSNANTVTEDRTVAAAHLSGIMEELHTLPSDQLAAYQPPAQEGLGAQERFSVVAIGSDGSRITFPIATAQTFSQLPNPFEVQATVTWRDRDGHLQVARGSTMVGR